MSRAGKPKPKIKIGPFKNPVPVDKDFSKKTWKTLADAIKQIHAHNSSNLSFEELYRTGYTMVLHKCGTDLYKSLKDLVREHLQDVAGRVAACKTDDDFMTELEAQWRDHKVAMLMIRDVLMYMDRVLVPREKLAPVYDLGLGLWCQEVASHKLIQSRLLRVLLELVAKERDNQYVDRSIMKSLTQMLVDAGVDNRDVYVEQFEKPFLQTTQEFYTVESQTMMQSNSVPDYLKYAQGRLTEETMRVTHYLDEGSRPLLKKLSETCLVHTHMNALVDSAASGLIPMLRDTKTADLARLYGLLGLVDGGHTLLKDRLGAYTKEVGKAVVMDPERQKEPLAYVQALLDMKDKYDGILGASFGRDKDFQRVLSRSFESFVNTNPKSPEFVSLFVDDKLRKGVKGMDEQEVEIVLDKVMALFRFISEKDIFEKYYKGHLAKRLLGGKSVSEDAERTMLTKLKSECGFQFTSKLEGMFKDMRLSHDTMETFRAHLRSSGTTLPIELSVEVLTTGFWPTIVAQPCNLPAEIDEAGEVFRRYYLTTHSGRRLTWQMNMGTADVRAFFNVKKELNVSTYQMVVLMLFNNSVHNGTIPYKEIVSASGIAVPDLKRALQSLACGKYKVLIKEPKGRQVDDTDVFHFNADFTSKLFRIKVPTVSSREASTAERAETRAKVDEDRKHIIEAAIVRVMKSRKTLDHSNLVVEVTKQLSSRFTPNPSIIKKRIESLIEREYIMRDPNSRSTYVYQA